LNAKVDSGAGAALCAKAVPHSANAARITDLEALSFIEF